MTSDGWQPTNDVERALSSALVRGDVEEYRGVLGSATVWLPQPPEIGREAVGQAPWPTGVVNGRTYIIVCTSVDTMRATLGHEHGRAVPFPDLAHAWPDPAAWLAVNLGTPVQALFDAEAVARTAEQAERAVYPVDAAIRAAVRTGDHTRFALALLAGDLVLPIPADGRPDSTPGDPDFAWWRTSTADGTAVAIAYTNRQRLYADLGEVPYAQADLPTVLAAWPGSDLALAVNPGMPVTGLISGPAMVGLGEWVARAAEEAYAAAAAAADRPDLSESEREAAAYRAAQERVAALLRG
jgi:hypothetical protein